MLPGWKAWRPFVVPSRPSPERNGATSTDLGVGCFKPCIHAWNLTNYAACGYGEPHTADHLDNESPHPQNGRKLDVNMKKN